MTTIANKDRLSSVYFHILLVAVFCFLLMSGCSVVEVVSSDDISDGVGDCLAVADGWRWSRMGDKIVVEGFAKNLCDRSMYKLDIGVQLEAKVGDVVLSKKYYAYGTTPNGSLEPGQEAPFTIVFDDAKVVNLIYKVELFKAYWSPGLLRQDVREPIKTVTRPGTDKAEVEWVYYRNQDAHFSAYVPEGFTAEYLPPDASSPSHRVAFTPSSSRVSLQLAITIDAVPLTGDRAKPPYDDVDLWTAALISDIETREAKILSSPEETTVAGRSARRFVYSVAGDPVRHYSAVVVSPGWVHVISFGGPPESDAQTEEAFTKFLMRFALRS
jgi:hypothetical protein